MFAAIIGYICYFTIESVIFGTFAVILSRNSKKQYNSIKAIAIVAIFLIIQTLLITPLINLLDLKIGNPEVVMFFGSNNVNDLMVFNLTSLIFGVIQGIIGFVIGRKIVEKAKI